MLKRLDGKYGMVSCCSSTGFLALKRRSSSVSGQMALFSLALVSVNEVRFSLSDLLHAFGDGADAENAGVSINHGN
jgi:hypothetical protein